MSTYTNKKDQKHFGCMENEDSHKLRAESREPRAESQELRPTTQRQRPKNEDPFRILRQEVHVTLCGFTREN